MNLYRDRYSNAKDNAQDNLGGRTHYVDDGTLRFFHARVLAAEVFADGLLFGIIESHSLDMRNTAREFRGVLFDVFGDTVYCPGLGEGSGTSKQARKALIAAVAGFDAKGHTATATEQHRVRYAKECDELAAKVAA